MSTGLDKESANQLAEPFARIFQKLSLGLLSLDQLDWFSNLTFAEIEKMRGRGIKNSMSISLVGSTIEIPKLLFDIQSDYFGLILECSLGKGFITHILEKVVFPIKEMELNTFSKYEILKLSYDKDIIEHFGILNNLMTAEEVIFVVASLLYEELINKKCILPKDDIGIIIGYVTCSDTKIRVIRISYLKEKWLISCAEPGVNRVGTKVLIKEKK